MMKVCDCVKDSIWYDPRVMKQVYAYVKNDIDLVCVGLKDNKYQSTEIGKIPSRVLLADVDLRLISGKSTFLKKILRELQTNISMYRLIRDTNADIVHANDLNALLPAYFAAKRIGAKLIYDTHEVFTENPWMDARKAIKFVWAAFERLLIKRVDLVVCVSQAASDYFSQRYSIRKPMVVTNCISSETLKDIVLQEKADSFEVLNHGQFYGGRGYDVMIKAAPQLKDFEDIKLVLRGMGEMEEELHELAERFSAGNVRFDAPVKVYELIPYAAASSVGLAITEPISLNFRLSVSNKLFEYAAAGLPVIMSDIPEHRYLNDKYHFGIVIDENSPAALAEAIIKLHDDAELYKEFSRNAVKMTEAINWENEFEKLIVMEKHMLDTKHTIQ